VDRNAGATVVGAVPVHPLPQAVDLERVCPDHTVRQTSECLLIRRVHHGACDVRLRFYVRPAYDPVISLESDKAEVLDASGLGAVRWSAVRLFLAQMEDLGASDLHLATVTHHTIDRATFASAIVA
jgi:hypothetical protein